MAIILMPHVGEQAVRDASGRILKTVDVDTGMIRVYWRDDDDPERGAQVAFLHANGFLHFVIPSPPAPFVEEVKEAIRGELNRDVMKTGSPPPIEAPVEEPEEE